ncbi:MAG: hypothetical protein HY268_31155 [Deltaproteobacteria bacterium]|nr:hypothetical protein [Deltaproteobacteria bacterium]
MAIADGANAVVLLGDGNGSFGSPLSFPAGSSPVAVATEDFNRDNKPDLAVANSVSKNISILLNSVTFSPPQPMGVSARVGDQQIYLSWNPIPQPINFIHVSVKEGIPAPGGGDCQNLIGEVDHDEFSFGPQDGVNPSRVVIAQLPDGGSVFNGRCYLLTVATKIGGVKSAESDPPVMAVPGTFANPPRPASPILFLHGFLGDSKGTWGKTLDFLHGTLNWRFGGRLFHRGSNSTTCLDRDGDGLVSVFYGVDCIDPLVGGDPPDDASLDATGDFFVVDFGNNLANYDGLPKDQDGVWHQGLEVKTFIDTLVEQRVRLPLTLVGHSMGGLAARSALVQQPGVVQNVAALITYGTPHRGVAGADLLNWLQYIPDPFVGLAGIFGLIPPELGTTFPEVRLNVEKSGGYGDVEFGCASGQLVLPKFLDTLENQSLPEPLRPEPLRYVSIIGQKPLPTEGDRPLDCHSNKWDGLVPVSSASMRKNLHPPTHHRGIVTNDGHLGEGNDFPAILCALDPHCVVFTVHSPVDVEVMAPDGRMMAQQVAEIPGASYMEVEDKNGDPMTTVLIPFALPGNYEVHVDPKPDVLPTDTYTLDMTHDETTEVLAQDVQIQNIPPQGYTAPVPPPPNEAPISYSGQDQTRCVGSPVTLNGADSFDPDNSPQPLQFAWTQMSGPAVALTGATTPTPSFTPSVAGSYTFELIVNDGQLDSALDTVSVTVLADAISLFAPNGSEIWPIGSMQTIHWISCVSGNVQIQISRNGGTTWTTFVADTPNDSVQAWKAKGKVTAKARIRVLSVDDPAINDSSDSNFTITGLTVLSPNNGEIWPIGSTQTIRWKSVGMHGKVNIQLSRTGGPPWTTILPNTANDRQEAWTVTGPATAQAKIRVRSVSHPAIKDPSNKPFTIQ